MKAFILLIVLFVGYQKFTGGKAGKGLCFGLCGHHNVERSYLPGAHEFKISAPYQAMGKTYDAIHTFKLGSFQTLKGVGFGYSLPPNNDYGQDAKYFYLPPDRLSIYHNEYVKPGMQCPSHFMHHNARFYILVGATPTISKQLADYRFKIEYGGTPFAYVGHPMTYASSMVNGKPAQLTPSQHETAYSNVGTAMIQYDYYLVTGFATPDAPLENPAARNPAAF